MDQGAVEWAVQNGTPEQLHHLLHDVQGQAQGDVGAARYRQMVGAAFRAALTAGRHDNASIVLQHHAAGLFANLAEASWLLVLAVAAGAMQVASHMLQPPPQPHHTALCRQDTLRRSPYNPANLELRRECAVAWLQLVGAAALPDALQQLDRKWPKGRRSGCDIALWVAAWHGRMLPGGSLAQLLPPGPEPLEWTPRALACAWGLALRQQRFCFLDVLERDADVFGQQAAAGGGEGQAAAGDDGGRFGRLLRWAARRGHEHMVRYLLSRHMRRQQQLGGPAAPASPVPGGCMALASAAANGHAWVVQALLGSGVPVTRLVDDTDEGTPAAVMDGGHHAVARLLLNTLLHPHLQHLWEQRQEQRWAGTKLTKQRDEQEDWHLGNANMWQPLPDAVALLHLRAAADAGGLHAIVMRAAVLGRLQLLRLLIASDVVEVDGLDWEALLLGIEGGHLELVMAQLQLLGPHVPAAHWERLLFSAVCGNHEGIVDLLLSVRKSAAGTLARAAVLAARLYTEPLGTDGTVLQRLLVLLEHGGGAVPAADRPEWEAHVRQQLVQEPGHSSLLALALGGAIMNGHEQLAVLLLPHVWQHLNETLQQTALRQSAGRGMALVVGALLALRGPWLIEYVLNEALVEAARAGQVGVVQLLLDAGAQPGGMFYSSLSCAVAEGHRGVVAALLDALDRQGQPWPRQVDGAARAAALARGHTEVVDMLRDRLNQPIPQVQPV